ncbi:MAG: hypothetical protein OQK35_03175 [Alphaproteobacteria bacterium]|nr:hypothetical protein [Rhodospirillales bacterium]MCW9045313.1 hypothetical protein [Alphaproteobacteria bacterium]
MGRTAPKIECFTCPVVDQYVSLANQFTQDLSEVMLGPMWFIFLSITGLWIVMHGIRMILGKGDLGGLVHELIFVIIAAGLLSGQGPILVNLIYKSALSTMSGAASVVLTAGGMFAGKTQIAPPPQTDLAPSAIENLDGMRGLVATAEEGVFKIFTMGGEILASATLTDPSPIIFALALVAPYAILLIVYFAQVVVSIFRVMMFAALSPILMLALGFGWGRDTALSGLRTLFAAFMVLFGATVALAVCLYGVTSLGVANPEEVGFNARLIVSMDNPKLWVAIILGWLGTAFLAEATGMANSIAGSQLTNQAAAVITGGLTATGLALLKQGSPGNITDKAKSVATGAITAGTIVSNPIAASKTAYSHAINSVQTIKDRIKNPTIDNS